MSLRACYHRLAARDRRAAPGLDGAAMAEHVLVIGGTGMLKDACLALAATGRVVSVVGRDPDRLEAMMMDASAAGNMLSPLQVDYTSTEEFTRAIRTAIERFGPVDTVLAWVRSWASEVLPALAREVSEAGRPWRLFHVRASASGELPAGGSPPDAVLAGGLCAYREIRLGFVREPGGSRWLTDEEICAGVSSAVEGDVSFVVGVLEPWEERPSA
ncbi:MAG: SDR family NAD(P)-dependent oxidoreductase [Candidatus Wallbacteria bacterium]|nr:SDR family NAD(P)-dependent oxidoreductase [Candidatus Wallbacteria bacterium]